MTAEKFGKDRSKLIIACTLMISALVIGVVFLVNDTLRFVVSDRLEKIGKDKIELTPDTFETVTVSLEELKDDSRVTFNESMLLINGEHLIENREEREIVAYKDTDVLMNACIVKAYDDLSRAVNELFGEKLYISSSYRTADEQLRQIIEEGDKAQQVGASEHQAGLALDVYILYHGGYGILDCEAGKWLNSNCGDYGFIIRYPYYGKSKTGIDYEPWHLRYVGLPHSEIISNNAITLEEYLDCFEEGGFYSAETAAGSWIISRQRAGDMIIPESFTSCTVSEDNCGNYILTFVI